MKHSWEKRWGAGGRRGGGNCHRWGKGETKKEEEKERAILRPPEEEEEGRRKRRREGEKRERRKDLLRRLCESHPTKKVSMKNKMEKCIVELCYSSVYVIECKLTWEFGDFFLSQLRI